MNKIPNDHDLLIVLETKLDSVIESIHRIEDGTKVTLADHEVRIRQNSTNITRIMTYGSALLAAAALVDVAARLYWHG